MCLVQFNPLKLLVIHKVMSTRVIPSNLVIRNKIDMSTKVIRHNFFTCRSSSGGMAIEQDYILSDFPNTHIYEELSTFKNNCVVPNHTDRGFSVSQCPAYSSLLTAVHPPQSKYVEVHPVLLPESNYEEVHPVKPQSNYEEVPQSNYVECKDVHPAIPQSNYDVHPQSDNEAHPATPQSEDYNEMHPVAQELDYNEVHPVTPESDYDEVHSVTPESEYYDEVNTPREMDFADYEVIPNQGAAMVDADYKRPNTIV